MMTRTLVLLALAVAACQGKRGEDPPPAGEGSGTAAVTGDAPRADAMILPPEDAPKKPDEVEPPDPGKVIAELGAFSAWQAVIDRARYLGRRGERGVVYGRLGPVIMVPGPMAAAPDAGVKPPLVASPYHWLVDDTEGNGTLGIRVQIPDAKKADVKEGDRLALDGAWLLDDAKKWYWKADTVQPIPPPSPSDLKDPPAPVPSHAIASGELPSGARTISLARDGDAVYFQVVGPPPANEGDGWQVADELGNPTVALLNLPGERASYGGLDMRQPDERWVLKRGQTYWVRIGKIRKRAPDKPWLINARTAPVRVM
ncbi:MAG: hypothetical protein JNL83_07115 [Myxococcales bacterium]|nr:hypothetical protein [Myxococcales bacterium]